MRTVGLCRGRQWWSHAVALSLSSSSSSSVASLPPVSFQSFVSQSSSSSSFKSSSFKSKTSPSRKPTGNRKSIHQPKGTSTTTKSRVVEPIWPQIRVMFCYTKEDVRMAAHHGRFRKQWRDDNGNGNDTVVPATTATAPTQPPKRRKRPKQINVHQISLDHTLNDQTIDALDDAFDERIYPCAHDLTTIYHLAHHEYHGSDVPPLEEEEEEDHTVDDKNINTTTNHRTNNDLQYLRTKLKLPLEYYAPTTTKSTVASGTLTTTNQLSFQWQPLLSLDQLHRYHIERSIPVALRLPTMYQSTPNNRDDYRYSATATTTGTTNGTARRMEQTIWGLVCELHDLGWVRVNHQQIQTQSSFDHSLYHDDNNNSQPSSTRLKSGQVVNTRDWIVQLAQRHTALQDLLLSHPGALDHMVQCLHYDFLWTDTAGTDTKRHDE